jgi:cytoskeleton protein RodZ
VATVGERLRQAREQAGLSLSDVAARTKIQRWILEDIERDDLSRVPGGVFVRGYLTSFARVVGIDANPLWADYRAATQTVEQAVVVERRAVPIVSRWTVIRVVGIVLVAAVMWMNAPRRTPDTVAATPPASPTAAPKVPTPAPEVVPVAATTGSTAQPVTPVGDSHLAEPNAVPLVVQVHANGECWIDASADGEQKAYRLLTAGEELRLEGAKEIRMLVGDAAAVSYSINGKPARALGASGVVREIVVPATGYEALVEPSAG